MPLDCFAIRANGRSFPARTDLRAPDEPTLGDLFAIKRGLATGSNSFFILSDEESEELAHSAPISETDSCPARAI